jgi:hypothetical protein
MLPSLKNVLIRNQSLALQLEAHEQI